MTMPSRRGPVPAEGRWLYDLLKRLSPDRRHDCILEIVAYLEEKRAEAESKQDGQAA